MITNIILRKIGGIVYMIMVMSHVEEAGYHVEDFILRYKRLPYYVPCSCYSDGVNKTPHKVKLSMPQFLYVTTSLLDVNFDSVELIDVNNPTLPSGAYQPSKIKDEEYRAIAKNIRNFMVANGRAPNYAKSSIGKLPYETLIYMYARIWVSMSKNGQTPHYIQIINSI